ncbi:MAG: kelch repeat-containing protein [Verrucomicrobiota bacterium]
MLPPTSTTHTRAFAVGAELGGAPYSVTRTVLTYNVASLPAGNYYAYWTTCCRVSGILNVSEGNFDLETGIVLGTQGSSETEPNSTLATAQNLEALPWTTTSSSLIGDTTTNTSASIPHLTINGTGNGTMDYYSVAVTAGSRGIFDIDEAASDAALFLYNAAGNLLAQNDNADSRFGQNGSVAIANTGIILDQVNTNGSLATAQSINGPTNWSLDPNPNILNASTVPHVTVRGTTSTTSVDFWSFTVSAGAVGTFDFDGLIPYNNVNVAQAPYATLYNSSGTELTNNFQTAASSGAGGSTGLEPFIQYTFATAGTYYLKLANHPGGSPANGPLGQVSSYDLQVSLTNHAVDPVPFDYTSKDPYIEHTFATAGTYIIGVAGSGATGATGGITGPALASGAYRLQVSAQGHAVQSAVSLSASPTQRAATIDIIAKGYTYTQNLNCVDPDGTPVSYQLLLGDFAPNYGPVTQITGLNLDSLGNVNISAANTNTLALGRWAYKTRVTDGQGAFSERDVLVVVENAASGPGINPNPPVLTSIPPKTVPAGSLLTFTTTATDADNDTVRTRAQLLPSGATYPETSGVGTVNGTFSWTPQVGQEGVYTVNIEAFDSSRAVPIITSQLVQITVTGGNNPPVLDPVGNKVVANGGTVTFQVSGSDLNGHNLTYAAFFLPAGATFTPATRTFTWTPAAGQYNSTVTNVTFRVTDDGSPNLSDEEAINITVGAGNQAPLIQAIANFNTANGAPISLPIAVTDAAGQTITVTAPILPSGAVFTAAPGQSPVNTLFTWTPTIDGVYQLRIRAEDNGTPILSSIHDIFITVGATSLVFTGVPVVTEGTDYIATGKELPTREMSNFSPANGVDYTYLDITNAADEIIGTFNDLPDHGLVAMNLNGVIYYFQVNYHGGPNENDLVFTNYVPPQPAAWTWLAGPKSRNGVGIYGNLGVAAAANNPGARQGAMNWLAADGSLWMLGGYGYATAVTNPPRYLNDLWQYRRDLGQWVWRAGASTFNGPGTYGSIGVEAAGNTPGARHTGTTWTDGNGNLWLFGGYGIGASGAPAWLNDLWRYNVGTGRWAHMKGSTATGGAATYGTQGTAAAANTPGARSSAAGVYRNGALWLLGGYNGTNHHNDLWRYDIASGNWTWMEGSSTPNQNGVYGTQGTAAAANTPGSRRDATGWLAKDGNLWFFGGLGLGATGSTRGDLNDLWRYDPVTGNWAWIKGGNAIGAAGIYGTVNTPAPGNQPGGRSAGSGWVTIDGDFWLIGGFKDSNLTFNDVWIYDVATNQWTWKQGAAGTLSVPGVYGTRGVAAAGNHPGGRFTPSTWVTLNGSFWIFGGGGADSFGNTGRLSDLWSHGIQNPSLTPYDNEIPAAFPDDLIVNASPSAGDASAGTMAYVPVSGQLTGTDTDGDQILFSAAGATTISQGTLTLNLDGTWTYTPAYGFTGVASFQFKAADNYGGESAVKTLVISVIANLSDSDKDGIADSYEQSMWGGLAAADGDGDADFDGQSNYFEFLAGTNPLDGSETLATAPTVSGSAAADGSVQLQLNHVRPGVFYHLESSGDLDAWSRIGTFTFSIAGSATIEAPTTTTAAPKFYRMSLEATPAVMVP